MNTDKQRVAIAEACGWRIKQIRETTFVYSPDSPVGNGYLGALPDSPEILDLLPDYLTDLDAMHEAENVLLKRGGAQIQWEAYSNRLANRMGCIDIFHATAAQRAEAFLKTLNLWEE